VPITEKQRLQRRKHIGGSDVPAICGLDPFQTEYDVYLNKTGQVEGPAENEAMQAGTFVEPGILSFASHHLGPVTPNQYRAFQEAYLGCHVDAIVRASQNPVECKSSGLHSPLREHWGDSGTDDIPSRVIVQAHAHMICTKKQLCHVAALLGGLGFRMYAVELSDTLAAAIVERCKKFWETHVIPQVPPVDSMPSLEVVRRVKRIPESVAEVHPELVASWLEAKQAEKDAAKFRKAQEAALLAALGQAEAGDAGEAGHVTYFERERSGYTVKPTKYRALYHKKGPMEK
jgi:putative phage-type endonuclease